MAGIKVKIKSNNGTLDFYFNSGDQSLIITKYKSKSKYKDNKDDISLGLLEDSFIDQFLEKDKETGKTLVDQLIEDHGLIVPVTEKNNWPGLKKIKDEWTLDESRYELFSNLSELSNVVLRLNFNSIEIERE